MRVIRNFIDTLRSLAYIRLTISGKVTPMSYPRPLGIITLLMFISSAHAEERVQHYEAQKPANVEQALKLLTERGNIAEQALKKNQLEAIHEQSYTLEAAGDTLYAHMQAQQKSVDAINEAIQEIHALSEKGDAAGVRAALPRLKKETQALQSLMQCK
jgi:hypothetical protein